MIKRGKAEKAAARSARLAAALRENLKRRKAQAKERERQSDLQHNLACNRWPGEAAPADDAKMAVQAPDFRRNRDRD
jgi:hypothetical protein